MAVCHFILIWLALAFSLASPVWAAPAMGPNAYLASCNLSIDIATDKQSYAPSELVKLSGTVRGAYCAYSCPPNSTCDILLFIELKVLDPSGRIAYSNTLSRFDPGASDFGYGDNFMLSSNSAAGAYTAEAQVKDFPSASSQTVFSVAEAPKASTSVCETYPFACNATIIGPVVVAIVVIVASAVLFVLRRRSVVVRQVRKGAVLASVPAQVATKVCGSCRAELPSDAKFCDNCGAGQK